MIRKRRALLLLLPLLLPLLFACGDERSLEVRLGTSSESRPDLDPFRAEDGALRRVRVEILGTDVDDDAVFDLDPDGSTRVVSVDGLTSGAARVFVEGFDATGTVVAYGRSGQVDLEAVASVTVPFRRNLAYITHRPNPRLNEPGRSIYVIDLATRVLVEAIRLPGTAPVARSVTARGGRDMIVTFQDGTDGFVGLLSLDDHRVRQTIALPGVQDLALGVEGSALGVALGGGRITFLDFEVQTAEELERRVGGRVLDAVISADGTRALIAVDVFPPGLLLLDLVRRQLEPLTVVPSPGGVALDASGQVAFVTSRTSGEVASLDLRNRQVRALSGGFGLPVDLAVYSESLRAVLGIDRSGPIGRILSYNVPSETALPLDAAVETLEDPTGMASDGPGRRVIVVAAGSSTASAGLTIVDTFSDRLEGSGRLYPREPQDPLDGASSEGRPRFQPSSVAIVYGR